MEFKLPYYKKFKHTLTNIAYNFSLNPEKLRIEFFSPNSQAIFVECVDNQEYKIHINLQENRIISIQKLSNNGGYSEYAREKYRQFMK